MREKLRGEWTEKITTAEGMKVMNVEFGFRE